MIAPPERAQVGVAKKEIAGAFAQGEALDDPGVGGQFCEHFGLALGRPVFGEDLKQPKEIRFAL